ncbi:MAG: hypothetical protein OIN85_00265 [Candidatus Methanoperedens sp.]|nr:hypothetical protein [Candidatus Methanoperedens sp.]
MPTAESKHLSIINSISKSMQPSTNSEIVITNQSNPLSVPKELPNNKLKDLIDKWARPGISNNLKIWIHKPNNIFIHPSIGIGLGTKSKPNVFTFVVLDNNSVQWLENVLKESLEIYNNNKNLINNAENRLTLWEKKKELDRLRKISISVSVVKKGDNTSIVLMINSKAFLYTDLCYDDIDWILTTLHIAKNSLESR